MNEVYDDLKNMLEVWFEDDIALEEIVAALHIFTIQCETTMRMKHLRDLQDDTE